VERSIYLTVQGFVPSVPTSCSNQSTIVIMILITPHCFRSLVFSCRFIVDDGAGRIDVMFEEMP